MGLNRLSGTRFPGKTELEANGSFTGTSLPLASTVCEKFPCRSRGVGTRDKARFPSTSRRLSQLKNRNVRLREKDPHNSNQICELVWSGRRDSNPRRRAWE